MSLRLLVEAGSALAAAIIAALLYDQVRFQRVDRELRSWAAEETRPFDWSDRSIFDRDVVVDLHEHVRQRSES